MNKHITSILFAVLMLLCFNQKAKADEVTWTEVATAAEFATAINTSSSANIRLTADIDLSKITPASSSYLFNITFSGKITGEGTENGYKITYRLKNSSETLFKALSGAEISQMFVMSSSFTGRDLSSGMLADDAENSNFTSIIFSKITAEGSSSTYDCDCMGVVVGKASNCHFTNLGFLNCELVTDGWRLGTVVGEATSCQFNGCSTNVGCQLWADGNSTAAGVDPNAYVGGICGYATSCTLTKCINFAVVMSDDDCTGGMVGYGSGTTIEDCRNGGAVKSCTKAGFGREVRETVRNYALGIGAVSSTAAIITSIYAAQWDLEEPYTYNQNGQWQRLENYDPATGSYSSLNPQLPDSMSQLQKCLRESWYSYCVTWHIKGIDTQLPLTPQCDLR